MSTNIFSHMIVQSLLGQAKKIDKLDAELLLAHVLKKPREYLLIHQDEPITVLNQLRFRHLVTKRTKGMPLAYLTGHKEFFGLDFFVNKNVLVPRPETEILVESAIEIIFNLQSSVTLIDVGTGSGCIPIAINKTLQQLNTATNKQTGITTHAIDISHRALRVVKKNAKKHNVKINFHQGNLIEPIAKSSIFNLQSSLIITANLPYLTQKQFDDEKSIQKEPKLALVADNKNGLSLYEKLLTQLKSSIFNLQSSVTLLLEINPSQTTDIRALVKNIFPSAKIEIKKDLAGHDRVVTVSFP